MHLNEEATIKDESQFQKQTSFHSLLCFYGGMEIMKIFVEMYTAYKC